MAVFVLKQGMNNKIAEEEGVENSDFGQYRGLHPWDEYFLDDELEKGNYLLSQQRKKFRPLTYYPSTASSCPQLPRQEVSYHADPNIWM